MADVATMLNKIHRYNDVLRLHGFRKLDCGGRKPWSHRATNDSIFIDTRNSEWTAYSLVDIELASGPDPETLNKYLTGAGI